MVGVDIFCMQKTGKTINQYSNTNCEIAASMAEHGK
jgi:hypothetical protein